MRRQTRERRRNGRRERRCDDKRNVDNEKTHAKENQTRFLARLSSHRLSCAYPHIVYPASGVISSQPRVGRLIVSLASFVSTSLSRVSCHRPASIRKGTQEVCTPRIFPPSHNRAHDHGWVLARPWPSHGLETKAWDMSKRVPSKRVASKRVPFRRVQSWRRRPGGYIPGECIQI